MGVRLVDSSENSKVHNGLLERGNRLDQYAVQTTTADFESV